MGRSLVKKFNYRDELLMTNPGSTCVVKVDDFEGSGKIKDFQGGCRKCISLDGCFLKGVTKGKLFVVVAKDANNHMLSISCGVGLRVTIMDLLLEVEHMMCAIHILANRAKHWRSLERRNQFWKCSRSTFEG
ncbi:hypothetical protein H5410_061824 [Solanum commersonii]|uniref:Uncharacterized protein n=1 Tax=Solanum commersonii TaxID=4109 RepID=A0A9J5W928_SOLCO|nr:hypothetical protein H5410_061824 [Solanum commersonii]